MYPGRLNFLPQNMTGIPFNIEMCPDSNVNERRMAQDLITNLDPYNGVCEKYENGKRRMYVILSPEEVCIHQTGVAQWGHYDFC